MIKINIDMSKNIALKKTMGESIHMSLMGSPAYINNEILLNVDQDPNNIILLVGEDNDYNTEISVEPIPISKISENTSKDYKFTTFSKKIENLLNCTFLSIRNDLLSAPWKYQPMTSRDSLYSGCFEDNDSKWVQKFIVVRDEDLEAAIDKNLSDLKIMDISSNKSTDMIGYTKIRYIGEAIYVFVISASKNAINVNFESMQNSLYLMISRMVSLLPDGFFTYLDLDNIE